ncbi:MAG: VPGUxxT family thioredoxin-like (seleno)protein, type 2 [Planctomycetota bacterium]
MNRRSILLAGSLIVGSVWTGSALAQSKASAPDRNPVEIGAVNWGRDLDAAFSDSERTGKPVLLLFQEVPGCAGCQKFGREVLSHPVLVEAVETEFIPVVVFNNRSAGPNRQTLERFGERAWNYQVIRFLDSAGADIIPRKEGVWSVGGVVSRMVEALAQHERPVPKYLETLHAVTDLDSHDQVAFAMHCFWTGEYRLGGIDGVIATEAGWLHGREVTLVCFDTEQLSVEDLARQAAQVRCADQVYTGDGRALAGLRGGKLDRSYRTASNADQKRQLMRWNAIAKVPGINPMQLTKINSLAPQSVPDALQWLSPRQRAWLVENHQSR